jgi:gamma-glutamylcyclotransferase (GGCT)/AIG2-like uncharacterized protein YtfP
MAWNFAFGSHLSSSRIAKIIGAPQDSRRAALFDYALTFRKVASFPAGSSTLASGGSPVLVPKKGDKVYGAAYMISEEQLKILDEYEAEWGYDRVDFSIKIEGIGRVLAAAHNRTKKGMFVPPADEFLALMVEGLRGHGYPESVVREVKAIALNEKNHKL